MEDRKIRVAITHGDTNGIGYEMIFKTFAEQEMLELCTPIIYGSPKVAAYHRNVLGIQANFSIISKADEAHDGRMNLLTVFEDDVKVDLGKPSDESGAAAVKALERAIEDQKNGLVDAIVAAPVNESTFKKNGKVFNGQSALLESELKNGAKTLRMIIGKKLRLAFATTDIPLKEVSTAITKELIEEKAAAKAESTQAARQESGSGEKGKESSQTGSGMAGQEKGSKEGAGIGEGQETGAGSGDRDDAAAGRPAVPPQLVAGAAPAYPEGLRRQGIEGAVRVRVAGEVSERRARRLRRKVANPMCFLI